jgi:hypothetical protein
MNDLLVAHVEPFSGAGDECVSVTLKSTCGEIVAFCHLGSCSVGDRVPNLLHSGTDHDVRVPFFLDWPEEEKERLSREWLERTSHFGYRGCGRCINEAEGLVEVNGFVIEFGEVPWDGPVEFEIARLDLWMHSHEP